MAYRTLKLEADAGLAILRFDRPDVLNALDAEVLHELAAALAEAEADPQNRVLVLASTHPKAFVAGADIKAMRYQTPDERFRFARLGHDTFAALEASRLVTVAAVDGYCLGGGFELALACDLIAAGPKALFGFPEIGLGLLPGFGGTQRFTRSVGMHAGLKYILTGERFDANRAEALGLIWRRFDADNFEAEVLEAARALARQAPAAMAAIKRVVRAATHTDLATGCDLEIGAFGAVGTSADALEGMTAFLEKRKPEFRGA